jgi:hypothetical protein
MDGFTTPTRPSPAATLGAVPDRARAKMLAALKAMLEETAKIQPMPTGLGCARYMALEAVELAEGPFTKAGDAVADIVSNIARILP